MGVYSHPHPSYSGMSREYGRLDSAPDGMADGDSEGDDDEGDHTREEEGDGEASRSQSADSKDGAERSGSKKKPRITLARGGACVACR